MNLFERTAELLLVLFKIVTLFAVVAVIIGLPVLAVVALIKIVILW
jgi:hypothetical protein